MPSSASSPIARSFDTGRGGWRRLRTRSRAVQVLGDDLADDLADIGDRPPGGDRRRSAPRPRPRSMAAPRWNESIASSRVGPPASSERSKPRVSGANSGSCSRPAAIRWDRKPTQSRSSSSSRYQIVAARPSGEVREQRRLAIAGIGDHVDHPAVDLRLKPVQQAGSSKGLVPQRRGLDLGGLDRITHAMLRSAATRSGAALTARPGPTAIGGPGILLGDRA